MIFFLFLISFSSAAIYGLDMCTVHSVSSLQCFIEAGFTFTIPRCWCSTGEWDSGCVQSVQNSHDAGMSRSDVYFFPCFSCGNVAGQVSSWWSQVQAEGVGINRVWMDVEGTWSSSFTTNQAFFEEMMNQVEAVGAPYGLYVSNHQWENLLSLSYIWPKAGSTLLWYPHYDDWESFGDFEPFGGFTQPYMKQYNGDQMMCGHDVDYNYRP